MTELLRDSLTVSVVEVHVCFGDLGTSPLVSCECVTEQLSDACCWTVYSRRTKGGVL